MENSLPLVLLGKSFEKGRESGVKLATFLLDRTCSCALKNQMAAKTQAFRSVLCPVHSGAVQAAVLQRCSPSRAAWTLLVHHWETCSLFALCVRILPWPL